MRLPWAEEKKVYCNEVILKQVQQLTKRTDYKHQKRTVRIIWDTS